MSTGAVNRDWRTPDELWAKSAPLLPPGRPHPFGCHCPRVDDRKAMDAIFYVLRTGCQWNALTATGICSSSAAHRRFQEWVEAGMFERLSAAALQEYDELQGIDWAWQAMDGAQGKAPLGGGETRPQSNRSRQARGATQRLDGGSRRAHWARQRRGQSQRLQAGAGHTGEHSPPAAAAA